jgi:hypothetical protein
VAEDLSAFGAGAFSSRAISRKEPVVRTVKEMIVGNQKVRFAFYRDGDLWYETECGFQFPVPIADAGTATFLAEDRAILFMRYIRKHVAVVLEARQAKGRAGS